MGTEPKGRPWFGKIYNKLETILVELDTFTSQSTLCSKSSDPPGLESIIGEPEEVAEDHSSRASNLQEPHDRVASPSCISPSNPPALQNFEISGQVHVEERVQKDILKENLSATSFPKGEILFTYPLLEEYCEANLTPTNTLGDEEPIVTNEESQITLTRQKFCDETKEVAEDCSSRASIVQQHHDTVGSPSCKSPSDSPSHQDIEISGDVRVEERVLGDILNENLVRGVSFNENLSASSLPDEETLSTSPSFEEYCDEERLNTDEESQITSRFTPQKFFVENSSNYVGEEIVEEVRIESCGAVGSIESQSTQSSLETFETVLECNDDSTLAVLGFSMDDSNLNAPVQGSVANIRSSNADNPDDVITGKSNVAPSVTNALYEFREDPSYINNNINDSALCAMRATTIALLETNEVYDTEFREDPSYVNDNELHAMRLRTNKLRSFKRKILDALTSKRRREKEYEQLAIWFGDAEMGSDLATEENTIQGEAIDSKSSQVLGSEDSRWELL